MATELSIFYLAHSVNQWLVGSNINLINIHCKQWSNEPVQNYPKAGKITLVHLSIRFSSGPSHILFMWLRSCKWTLFLYRFVVLKYYFVWLKWKRWLICWLCSEFTSRWTCSVRSNYHQPQWTENAKYCHKKLLVYSFTCHLHGNVFPSLGSGAIITKFLIDQEQQHT